MISLSRSKLLLLVVGISLLASGITLGLVYWRGHLPGKGAGTSQPAAASQRKVLYWVDAMNPTHKSEKPGKASDGMDLVPVYADEPAPGEAPPPGAVKISSEKQQLIGVQYGTVAERPVTETIRAVGRVTYDETKIARIHTKVEGWIDQVFVNFTGKLVEKNQPLISIYSPDLVSTQQEFLIAKRGKDALGNNPHAEIAQGAASLYDSSRERLRLWDVNDEQIRELEERGTPSRTLTLYSPIGGFVVTRNAFDKQRITPDTELYTIADLSTVWVLADIYEYELPQIHLDQAATMTLSYFPGRAYAGKISYIYPQLDNSTRTVKVRVEFANPGFELKPDMYANVELKLDYGKQLSVPEEAVMDSGSEQIVFVAREGGYFEPRKVQLGAKVDDRYIVLSGLRSGEKIVTSGNFLIDSESRLKSATEGMAGMAGMGPGGGGKSTAGVGKSQKEEPKAKPAEQPKEQMPKDMPMDMPTDKPKDQKPPAGNHHGL
jgi:multidrug efflux pump subunit AcrA (membrane-fusion protein)